MQRTIKAEITVEGIGLHTGGRSAIRLKPAPKDTGVLFYRRDKNEYIAANVGSVCETSFATTLGLNGAKVRTVEHLLAALAGLGVDNVLVEMEGSEIPILDGSSGKFVEKILAAGVADQPSKRPHMRITKPFVFREGDAEISAFPYGGRRITYQTFYPHRLLGAQQLTAEMEEETFIREIAPARTFGFLKDVQYLRAHGLARGGSLDNAIILSDTGVINPTGLRFKDEFIRHKLLDFIGDLSLIGFPIQGYLTARKTGHASNLRFAAELLAASDCWEITSGAELVIEQPRNIKYA
ncbi:MAG: UDP-3-O-acyl-N-acetylglucosamine deacetylase [Nitrospiraceae bacterium]|nr:UDP-3-O-acyl-N-acetylglucosamine deacetylase [Nitrospiraceae bacterium]